VDFLTKEAVDLAQAGNCPSGLALLRQARSVVAGGRRAKEVSLHEARDHRAFIGALQSKLARHCLSKGQ
jgi:hypothetical protein